MGKHRQQQQQAGSIDGTDILPHDNAVYRALLCSSAGLYNPFCEKPNSTSIVTSSSVQIPSEKQERNLPFHPSSESVPEMVISNKPLGDD
ncbi:hypothetical protein Hanom_Chr06g00504631 [Helianthus anomalus]